VPSSSTQRRQNPCHSCGPSQALDLATCSRKTPLSSPSNSRAAVPHPLLLASPACDIAPCTRADRPRFTPCCTFQTYQVLKWTSHPTKGTPEKDLGFESTPSWILPKPLISLVPRSHLPYHFIQVLTDLPVSLKVGPHVSHPYGDCLDYQGVLLSTADDSDFAGFVLALRFSVTFGSVTFKTAQLALRVISAVASRRASSMRCAGRGEERDRLAERNSQILHSFR
jgi:hypothetical protein